MFPLASHLLMTGDDRSEATVNLAKADWAAYFNTVALFFAERWLFSHLPMFPMLTSAVSADRPAFEVVYRTNNLIVTMTPELFGQLVREGRIRRPVRIDTEDVNRLEWWERPTASHGSVEHKGTVPEQG
jgi:hypothetical protein